MHNPFDISSVIESGEHARLARGTSAFTKAITLNIDPDDMYSECAIALWKNSLSKNSKYDPTKASRSTYITMVCSSAIIKMIRKIAGSRSPDPHMSYVADEQLEGVSADEYSSYADEVSLRDRILVEVEEDTNMSLAQKTIIKSFLLEKRYTKNRPGYTEARTWLTDRLKRDV